MKKLVLMLLVCFSGVAGASGKPIPNLLADNMCSACHALDRKLVGPSYKDIGSVYNHTQYYDLAEEAKRLRTKLKVGGRMPPKVKVGTDYSHMGICPPAPKMSDEEIRTVVDWILAMK